MIIQDQTRCDPDTSIALMAVWLSEPIAIGPPNTTLPPHAGPQHYAHNLGITVASPRRMIAILPIGYFSKLTF